MIRAIILLLLLVSCSDKPANTGRIIHTLGHETLHCFFGEWHDPYGRHPSRIDVDAQLAESMTIVVRFVVEAELQRLYREAARTHTAPDKQITKVDGFNIRDPNTDTCVVYVLKT